MDRLVLGPPCAVVLGPECPTPGRWCETFPHKTTLPPPGGKTLLRVLKLRADYFFQQIQVGCGHGFAAAFLIFSFAGIL